MIPKRLEIKNFLSHDHSVIDFDKFNSALILGCYNNNMEESNGSGKSAILEAIRWALFDKARHRKKDGIVKRDATSCSVEFEFIIGKQLYRIIRKRNKVVSETDVTLEQWNNVKYESIDCDTNTATDNKIVQIINFTHDVFINSVYFKQGDISIFTDSTPSKRKDILKSLLKLDKWDNYQKQVKKYYGKISAQAAEKQKNYVALELIDDEIEIHNEKITKINRDLVKKNKLYKYFNEELIEKKSEYQFLGQDQNGQQRLENLEEEFLNTKKKLTKLKRTICSNKRLIESHFIEIKKQKEKLLSCNREIKQKRGINIEKKRTGLLDGKTKEKVMREQLMHLKRDLKLDKQCDSCLRPINSKKEAQQIKDIRRAELSALKQKHSLLVKKLNSSILAFKNIEKIVENGRRSELEKLKVESTLNIIKSELRVATKDNSQFIKEISGNNLKELKEEINNLKSKLDKENINNLKNRIKYIEDKLSSIKKSVDQLNIEYGSKVSNKADLIFKREEQKKIQKELGALNEKIVIYDKLRHCFGKDGIQSIIIENVVDELENYTNETLSKICNEPTSINIQMQKQSDSGSWTETFEIEVNTGSRKDELEALSGGEKFRISLALRLAFSKILSKRMGGVVKFLLLDEVSSSLDPKGLDMFADIVKQLSNEMKILIITHDDRLKDKFEDIVIVEKDSNGSRANI